MSISIQFLGAARHVTGSRHLLKVNDSKILIDCGMVQGPRRISAKQNRNLGVRAGDVDAVLLSHAHIDHSGSLPRLTKLGFQGTIHCTPASRDLLSILLPDSAHLQASDARYLKKRKENFTPPYDIEDVNKSLSQVRTTPYGEPFRVTDEVSATFIDAGHILGSAQMLIEVNDGRRQLRIAFTGDFGRKGMPILRDPDPLPPCDVLITESTYGDRLHPSRSELPKQICAFIERQRERAGRVLIPAFSVGRTQNILWYLGNLIHEGAIEPMPIFVDSPLSTKATAIVRKHTDLFDDETRAVLESGRDPFFFEGVRSVSSVDESKALNAQRQGVIISASGMLEGGRILHHLEQTIGRPDDCILIVGFQAQGTLGRKLLEGYEHVKIYGQRHRVRCRVEHIDGLSAHADYSELIAHLAPLARHTERVFVVHGEEDPAMKFSDRLWEAGFAHVDVPMHGETYKLSP